MTGRLGRGGMGVVYRGRDPRIGRAVAIKLLSLHDEALRTRFLQEAQFAGGLKHPNIVTIYDYGEHDEQPYIVMEFIEGVTLADHIRQNIPLSLPRKLSLIEELSLALDYAHNKGIVHRDIKPANIMVDTEGVLKVLDFGIARVGDSALTQAGAMVGTPNYMSPEQINGYAVDRRSDIFAVGLVFYELLSYKQAFPGANPITVLQAIVHTAPEPLEQACPGIHPALAAIVAKAIEKDPARRYRSLAALAADLTLSKNRVWAGRGSQSDQPTILGNLEQTPPPDRKTPPSTERDRVTRRRAEKLEEHLDTAQRAFEAGDYASAVEACEQAEVIDPDEPRVADLLARAHKGIIAQDVRQWLEQARLSIDRQNVAEASELVARALEADRSSIDAHRLQEEIDDHLRRARQEEERQRAIEASLTRARSSLARGDLDSAIRAASEVLVQDPTHAGAHELTRQAFAAAEERLQREVWERAAQTTVLEQKQIFAAGRWRDAIAALERFAPPHPAVNAALAELRVEVAQLEQRAREEEERRQAQQRWIANQLQLARDSLDGGRFVDAIELLERAQKVVPQFPGFVQLLEEARAGRSAAEAEAERQRRIKEALSNVDDAIASNRLDEALSSVDRLLGSEPGYPDALARRSDIRTRLDARRRKEEADRRADAAIEGARRRFKAGAHAAALNMLESFTPLHPSVTRARDELRLELQTIERAARQARIDDQRGQAQKDINAGRFAQALDRLRDLERSEGPVPDLKELLELARAGQGVADERARRENEIEALVVEARRRVERKDFTGAERRIEKALGIDPSHQRVNEARTALEAAIERDRREAEEERQKQVERARREADAARIERQQRDRAQLEQARLQLEQGQPSRAVRILEDLRRSVPEEKLGADLDALLATAHRQIKIEDLAAQARRSLQQNAPEVAFQRVEEALALDANAQGLLELRKKVQEAIADRARRQALERQQPSPVEDAAQDLDRPLPSSFALRDVPSWKVGAAAVAVVLVAAIGYAVYNWPAPQKVVEGLSTVAPTIATTSVPVGTIAPTTAAPEQSDMTGVVARVRNMVGRGELYAAAGAVAAGLKRAPQSPELANMSREVLDAAAARANSAKEGARSASSGPAYRGADGHIGSATRLRQAGRIEPAVAEYLTAERLFLDALKVPQQVSVLTTSIPTSTPTTTPVVSASTALTTVPPVDPRTSIPTTSAAVQLIDVATVDQLLRRYAGASRGFDVAAMQQIYPRLLDRNKDRLDALRRNYSFCNYTFTNIQIVSSTATEASVRADSVESCKPKTGQKPFDTVGPWEFRFSKGSSGSWIIREIFIAQ